MPDRLHRRENARYFALGAILFALIITATVTYIGVTPDAPCGEARHG